MRVGCILFCGCVLAAALDPVASCRSCCGVCTVPSCVDTRRNYPENTIYAPYHFFEENGHCTKIKTEGCKGTFYSREECQKCCIR
uniref:Pancreatic trypsin inhibitor n=1 Tax=Rhipicephalus appendiculatus TaxID=34631 RepID=A0A131YQS1_RHIAP